jgi:signal transduction histidine kinase
MAVMNNAELHTAWEDAYLAQCQEARVGRLFKGTIHNLNGVVQAFSMQSELFAMMFTEADLLLEEALARVEDEDARQKIIETRELLQKRQKILGQVEEKIQLSKEILKINEDISHAAGEGGVTLRALINNVITFFQAHMFFKHKVHKNITLEADFPVGKHAPALSVILANLVENSIQGMEGNPGQDAVFALRCFDRADRAVIEIEDNGIGVPEQMQEDLFQEFISATPGHPGLGLYQAKKLVTAMGGEIEITRPANPTVFTISLPLNLEKV